MRRGTLCGGQETWRMENGKWRMENAAPQTMRLATMGWWRRSIPVRGRLFNCATDSAPHPRRPKSHTEPRSRGAAARASGAMVSHGSHGFHGYRCAAQRHCVLCVSKTPRTPRTPREISPAPSRCAESRRNTEATVPPSGKSLDRAGEYVGNPFLSPFSAHNPTSRKADVLASVFRRGSGFFLFCPLPPCRSLCGLCVRFSPRRSLRVLRALCVRYLLRPPAATKSPRASAWRLPMRPRIRYTHPHSTNHNRSHNAPDLD